jgi:hypothetical protein
MMLSSKSKDRVANQHYSDQSAMNYDLSDDPVFTLKQDIRMKQIKSFVLWGTINVVIFIYLLIIVFRFWTSWFKQSCIHELSWWLCGYTYI